MPYCPLWTDCMYILYRAAPHIRCERDEGQSYSTLLLYSMYLLWVRADTRVCPSARVDDGSKKRISCLALFLFTGWPAGWPAGRLAGYLACWPTIVYWLTGWLAGRPLLLFGGCGVCVVRVCMYVRVPQVARLLTAASCSVPWTPHATVSCYSRPVSPPSPSVLSYSPDWLAAPLFSLSLSRARCNARRLNAVWSVCLPLTGWLGAWASEGVRQCVFVCLFPWKIQVVEHPFHVLILTPEQIGQLFDYVWFPYDRKKKNSVKQKCSNVTWCSVVLVSAYYLRGDVCLIATGKKEKGVHTVWDIVSLFNPLHDEPHRTVAKVQI